MVTALSSPLFGSLLIGGLLLVGGCGVGFGAGDEGAPADPFGTGAGASDDPFGGGSDAGGDPFGGGNSGGGDAGGDDGGNNGLPTPEGPYQGDALGQLAGESCEGYAWVFVSATGSLDGSFDCASGSAACSFSIDAADLDADGGLETEVTSCQGPVTLRVQAFDGELSGSAMSELVSVEFFANHTPEEGD
ncbi:MAG: hypothetical protein KDA24_19600 [Deltaproteobacteria bacterium]|nr:hypothetical protein [Deltaproteobacteria bacterium]